MDRDSQFAATESVARRTPDIIAADVRRWWTKPPSVRVTTEFDSDSSTFFHKASCKLLGENLAKLKFSFFNSPSFPTNISEPRVSFVSKLFSLNYDIHEQSTFLRTTLPISSNLRLFTVHNFTPEGQQSEMSMEAKLDDPDYAIELFSPLPSLSLSRATLKFPLGNVSLEKSDDEQPNARPVFLPSGTLKSRLLNGRCSAQFQDENWHLRYSYKDSAVSFTPSVSLPSNAIAMAFKRQFTPSNKLSYWFNFDTNTWSAVFKHKYGKDFKLKAGYDSEVRLGWASLWVGDEGGKAKTAPMKTMAQFMLQVPQDDIKAATLIFRVKKRWDI